MLHVTSRFWQIGFFVYVAFISALAVWPITLPEIPGGDKTNHILAFMVMLVWLKYTWPRLSFYWKITICFFYGILIEWIQSFLPFRVASMEDVLANTVGLLIAIGIILLKYFFSKK